MDDELEWIRAHVEPTGDPEPVKLRPWARTWRVPLGDTCAYFKACEPVQAFEPRLTAELARRHPTLLPEVIAYDERRCWLLLADAGDALGLSAPPSRWRTILPAYAELQREEQRHAADHAAHGVPDFRLDVLPERYEAMVARDLPLERGEHARLRTFAPRFTELCAELAAHGVGASIQHDDLHGGNVYAGRILDWGDSSVAHPFFSLVTTFRFVGEQPRLRDTYLEAWGPGHEETFALAYRLGWVALAIGNLDHPVALAHILRVAVRRALE